MAAAATSKKKADTETPDAGNSGGRCERHGCLRTVHGIARMPCHAFTPVTISEWNSIACGRKSDGACTPTRICPGAKGSIGDKAEGLHKAIHELKSQRGRQGRRQETPSSRPRDDLKDSRRVRRKTEIALTTEGPFSAQAEEIHVMKTGAKADDRGFSPLFLSLELVDKIRRRNAPQLYSDGKRLKLRTKKITAHQCPFVAAVSPVAGR